MLDGLTWEIIKLYFGQSGKFSEFIEKNFTNNGGIFDRKLTFKAQIYAVTLVKCHAFGIVTRAAKVGGNFLFLLGSHKAIIFNATKLSPVITNQKDTKRPGGR